MKKLILLVFAFAMFSVASVSAQTPVKKEVKKECCDSKTDKAQKKDAACCSSKDAKHDAKAKDHECCQDKAKKMVKKHDCCQDKAVKPKDAKTVKQAVKK